MWFPSWVRRKTLASETQHTSADRRDTSCRRSQTRCRLRLEDLEDRRVLSTFNVTTTLDGVTGSLRQAIQAANAHSGADTIHLAAGVYKLSLAGADEDLGATGDLDIIGDLK